MTRSAGLAPFWSTAGRHEWPSFPSGRWAGRADGVSLCWTGIEPKRYLKGMTCSFGDRVGRVSAVGISLFWLAAVLPACAQNGQTGSSGTGGSGSGGSQSGGAGGPGTGGSGGTGVSNGTGGGGGGPGGGGGGLGGVKGGGGGAGGGGAGAGGGGGGTGAGGTGGSAGATLGAGGNAGSTLPSGAFPSQACIDMANSLLAQMPPTEKYAQMMQMERAALTPALVTQYDIGSA